MGRTQKNVTKRAGIVSLGTLASRILGLVRESVIVAYFPKEVVDAYQTAFMIPNVFRRLTAEGAFSISVVSVFSKTWAQGDLDASRRFTKSVLGFALIFLTILTVIGVFGARPLTWLASSNAADQHEKFKLAVGLTRVMFPYVFLISLTSLAMGFLNSTGRFFAPAFAPVFLNVSIIGCAVGLTGVMPSIGLNPVFALAFGVILGGIAQIVMQLPSLKAAGLLVLPSIDFKHPGLVRVLRLTGPMVIGAAAYSIGTLINTKLAWTLPHGSVMYITSANRLVELPLAVLVMAISTAALPRLAALSGQKKTGEMKAAYNHALRLALFVATPAMVALVVLAEPVVAILYQRGVFTHVETVHTANGLRWLAFGICSVALLRQTVPVFYALENVWTPVAMTIVFIVTHISTGYILKGPFLHEGLCMALSIAATVQALGLVILLRKKIGRLGLKKTIGSWLRMLAASGVMAGVIFYVAKLGRWELGGNSIRNISVVLLTVLAGAITYALFAWLFKTPELLELIDALKRRRKVN